MGNNDYEMESINKKKSSGCKHWQVAVVCSVIIAIGLGVGLGVGLSNQQTVVVTEPESTTSNAIVTSQPTVPPGSGPWEDYRLPDYIIPSHYKLKLHPNMTTDTYIGTNEMTINVTQETRYVIVHVDAYLNITSVRIARAEDGNAINVVNEFRVPVYEYYVMESEIELEPQEYVLTMDFQGSLVGKIVGLYKTVYTIPETGEVKAMVGSDMEPTDARKAYPCFDEPAMKIRYTTTLVHERHLVALSNMDEDSQSDREDGLVETTFNPSVPMSCYLGCFAIGEFDCLERFSKKNNISLRIYLPPHQLDAGRADYALEILKIQFDYYEDLFQMDYSLPKLDMIAIPDFGTGAMENWGLITFRESNLLLDPLESSTYNKQRVAAVVAHELVHQWFGNIVTMKWWDNIWLNEGFASYLEYFGEREAESDWQIVCATQFDHFVTDDLQRAMNSDASVTSRSLVSSVTDPSEITSVFDTITYSKGATVLRYLNEVLGNETFFGGIRHYLVKREFSNANEDDLFNDMQEYADSVNHVVNISETMRPWVLQMGFPVLEVDTSDGDNVVITQRHYLKDSEANLTARPESEFGYKWNIEVTYITQNDDVVERVRFNTSDENIAIKVDSLTSGDWLKVNPGQTGYYRVKYDDDMMTKITQQLLEGHENFTEIDRTNLIDDAFNLATAEIITYQQALNMTKYLEKEKSYFVWDAFERGSSYVQEMLKSTQVYTNFQDFYRAKVAPLAEELGWNASVGSHVDKRNRVQSLSLALSYNDSDAIAQAQEYFERWIADEDYFLFPDTRQLVYEYGVKGASEDDWEEMVRRYVKEQVASERTNLLRGITSVENVKLIDRMLDNCWNTSVVRSQDFFNCVTYVSYTTPGNRMAWVWTQLNWERMVERFGITDRNFGRLIPNIVSDYNTELQLWEVESFFELYPDAGAGASGRVSAVNSIKTNIKWMSKHQDSIQKWLEEQ